MRFTAFELLSIVFFGRGNRYGKRALSRRRRHVLRNADHKSWLSGKGGKLEDHHLIPIGKLPWLALFGWNGVALTVKEHDLIHSSPIKFWLLWLWYRATFRGW